MSSLLPLLPYLCTGLYTEKMYEKVSNGRHYDLDNYLRFCNFEIPDDLYVCKYINEKLTKYKKYIKNQHISFQIINNKKILYIYVLSSFKKLFECKCTFIIRPIYCNYNNNMHLMSLIIDNKTKKIYVYDSNNNKNVTDYIETKIERIINVCKDVKYSVCNTSVWNNKGLIMNKISYISPIYFKGHCVITTLLLPHYALLSNKTIEECVEIFSNINNDVLFSLINNYSLFYYLFIY